MLCNMIERTLTDSMLRGTNFEYKLAAYSNLTFEPQYRDNFMEIEVDVGTSKVRFRVLEFDLRS
jgi:hypothetical protein